MDYTTDIFECVKSDKKNLLLKRSTFLKIIERLVILQFILLSGSVRFYLEYPVPAILFFVFTSFLLYWKNWKNNASDMDNKKLLAVLIGWNVVNNLFITRGGLDTNLAFSTILIMLGSFFAITSISFEHFRTILLRYLNILCVLSIIVQFTHDFLIDLPSMLSKVDVEMTLFLFNCDWGEHRLASIYWEPGQFQIILIFTLCLFIDQLKDLTIYKENLKKFAILLLSLVLTLSTTGYLALMIIIAGVVTNMQTKQFSKSKILAIFASAIICMGVIFQSDAIQMKIKQMNNTEEVSSFSIRSYDNIQMLLLCLESPLRGYGLDSNLMAAKKEAAQLITSSNGWLYLGMGNGLTYVIFIFVLMYLRLKEDEKKLYAILVLCALIASQCNEWLAVFPYIYMYIFKFRKIHFDGPIEYITHPNKEITNIKI